jgi:hypothetical protein
METLEILDAVQTLTANQRMFIAEKIIGSLRKEEQKERLKTAAETALFDYANDKALTALTQLDGEDFIETRRAAFNRLVGLTAENPVSLEEARMERLSKQ